MPAVVVPVVIGKDGRLYPPHHRRPPEVNARAAGYVHLWRHQGMPFRAITAKLGEVGLRVALGSVYHLWATTECDQCAEMPPEPPPPPDPRQRPQVFEWR
jgi:hypothetical protein